MSEDPYFVCKECHNGNNLSDLVEIEEEKPWHSHYECPECGGENFSKLPEEQPQEEPPDPPENHDSPSEPLKHKSADVRREEKRQSNIRQMEQRRR